MSTRSAPPATARSTASSAASSAYVAPRSKKESGVRFTTAMTSRSESAYVLVPSRSGTGAPSTDSSWRWPAVSGRWDDPAVVILFLLLAVGVLAVIALVAAGHGEGLAEAEPDVSPVALPVDAVTAADVAGVRFPSALRGYRMADVDAVLDRLESELAAREARVAGLHGRPPAGGGGGRGAT